ncbi:hypothetical protein GO308_05125 [Sphingomonas sp. SFZ2018-12]|uniref:hypothetical protein n=1 Tax=Sphingomonas sp. SFZ2018-12 TaxID=2683197 RepID=UPI001F106041|nr:hypothetical protein [Sphingomonas sp. SFZ2018-12]MCH4892490.1 hypothetical protein [Sphingomonas sp. SFZ2018-12]
MPQTRSRAARRDWSSIPIDQIIDREFGLNTELRNGTAAYVWMFREFERTGDPTLFLERLLDQVGAQYRANGQPGAQLLTFGDGSCNYLFDFTRSRVAMVWGVSRPAAPGTRDDAYHAGYPRAADGFDKGHAWSHAQGGREGGPNYFQQARRLNQARSDNGRLWRAIEMFLAAHAGTSAFIRLIYATGNSGDVPDDVEYGILSGEGQFRAVQFPNR